MTSSSKNTVVIQDIVDHYNLPLDLYKNNHAGGVRIERHIRNKKEKEKFTEQYEKCMSDTSGYKMRCANLKQKLRKKLLEKKN